MQSDTIKLLASTVVAAVLSLGGPVLLVWVMLQPAIEDKAGLTAILGAFTTYGIQFLFGQEQRTGAVRQFQAGLNTPTPEPGPH